MAQDEEPEKQEIKSVVHTEYQKLQEANLYPDSFQNVDTNIYLFHQYNKAYRLTDFKENLGNFGGPVFDLTPSLFRPPGFYLGINYFDYLRLTPGNIKYFNSFTPFTDLFYVQGGRNLQMIKGLHSRNIAPQWNIALRFERLASQGFYENQGSDNYNIGLNSWLNTKNKRYRLYFSVLWNKIETQENGGIEIDSNLLENTDNSIVALRKSADPNTDDSNQKWREKSISITQMLFLGKQKKDTLRGQDTVLLKELDKKFYFAQSTQLSELKYNYYDNSPDLDFYNQILFDTNYTNDFLHYHKIENSLWLGDIINSIDSGFHVKYLAGIKHSYHNIFQDISGGKAQRDSTINDFSAFSDLNLKINSFNLGGHLTYIFYGDNAQNFDIHLFSHYHIDSFKTVGIGIKHLKTSPDFISTSAFSNHLLYNMDFSDLSVSKICVESSFDNLNLEMRIGYNRVENYIYFNKEIKPVQFTDVIDYYDFELTQHIALGKFNFVYHFILQPVLDNDYFRLPSLIVRNNSYYQGYWFNKAILVQIGFDVRYNESYYAKKYYPVYGVHYIQSNQKVGNYFVIDPYISAKVKKARAFVKLEHANESLFSDDSEIIPGYPLFSRSIRFGISWRFYD